MTPDLLELTRRSVEALNRRDFDAAASSYAPNAVLKPTGMGASFEGVAAIRGFFEDFVGTFAEYQIEVVDEARAAAARLAESTG
jgi:ketosteroid isomerase-like protein